MTIGQKIRNLRKLRGLTQAELGSMVGLPGDRIRQYENDVRTPRIDKLTAITKALGADPSALSDINIKNESDIMHVFFELEEGYDFHLENDDYTFSIVMNKRDKESQTLIKMLEVWGKRREEMITEPEDDIDHLTDKKTEYEIWKYEFPMNLKDQEEKDLKEMSMSCSSLLEKNQDQIRNVETYADYVNTIVILMEDGLDPVMRTKSEGDRSLTAILSFSHEQAMGLHGKAAVHLASFLEAIKTLQGANIDASIQTSTGGKGTYYDVIIHDQHIASVIPYLNQIKFQILENTFKELSNQAKYRDQLSWLNQPIRSEKN